MATFLDNTTLDNLLSSPGPTGPLSTRKPKSVGKKRNQPNQISPQDMVSLFQSLPVPNRGFRNPNADKPGKMGQGMEYMDKNNSPAQVAARQANTDQMHQAQWNQRNNAGAAAVDFAKQTKGFTDANGNFVPPTLPSAPSSAYGSGSVTFSPAGQKPKGGTMIDPLTGNQVAMADYLKQQSQTQDTKYGAMPGHESGVTADNYFNPGSVQTPQTPQIAQTAPPQNDLTALFPGSPNDTPGQASIDARRNSLLPNLPRVQSPNMSSGNLNPYAPGNILDPQQILKFLMPKFNG